MSSDASGPELRGANITLDTILAKTDTAKRQTKIVCTMGPSCWDVPTLEDLIDLGMSVARFNFSHGDHEAHKACLDRVRQAAANKKKHIGTIPTTTYFYSFAMALVSFFISLFPIFTSCLVGYQGSRNSNWIFCRWCQEDFPCQGPNFGAHIGLFVQGKQQQIGLLV